MEVPADVDQRLHRRLAEFRDRIEQQPQSRLLNLAQSLIHPFPFRVPAMAAVLLLAVVVILAPRFSSDDRAYAAAATELRSASSLEYTVVLAPSTTIDFAYLAPGCRRVNCSWGTELRTDGTGKQLVLMHYTRTYLFEEGTQIDAPDLVEQFRSLPKTAAKCMGERWIGGKKLIGYHVNEAPRGTILGRTALDLWVNAVTENPDHVDISIREPGKPLYQMHITNIRVDATLDRSLFDMIPPAGYTKIGIPVAGQQTDSTGNRSSDLRPVIERTRALTAVVIPMKGSYEQTRAAVEAVAAQLSKMGVTPVGSPFGLYESEQHWEAGYPVPPGTRVEAPFETVTLPATSIASAVVTGPWGSGSGSRWSSLLNWIIAQRYVIAGSPIEFWSGDDAHPQSQTTEMRIAVSSPR
ncbi:MAG: hypothetical protein ACLQVD_01160 [Capsulimonadaceae bacterium]